MLAVCAIFIFGTFGYYLIEEDWTLFESFYMTAITITTVGYGEIRPLSELGRWFTVVLIFMGLGTVALFAGQLARTFLENNFKEIFGANKMKKQIERLSNHFIVCGFGDIGSSICSGLDEAKVPFVVIEANEETAEFAIQRKYPVVKGKATYDVTLLQAGIKDAMGIVICLGDDSINMHVSLAAREINPDIFIIARGYKSHIEKRMVRAGANTVINPLKIGGEQIAELIIKQYSEELHADELMMAKSEIMGFALKMYQHFQVEPSTVGHIKNKFKALNILKLRKSDGSELVYPAEDTDVNLHETLLLLIDEEAVSEKIEDTDQGDKPYFEWSEDYSVNIKSIDVEHQKLFELANEFLSEVKIGNGKVKLSETFDKLIDYTTIHFKNEELLFEKYDYPGRHHHIKEHQILVEKVLNLNKNKTYIFPYNVADFLFSWIKDHIVESDLKYVEFFQDKKV